MTYQSRSQRQIDKIEHLTRSIAIRLDISYAEAVTAAALLMVCKEIEDLAVSVERGKH